MANEMQEVLGEHATTANLLVAEERIRGHLARGGLAAASPDEAASNGKATPKGGRKAAKASHNNGAESQPKSARDARLQPGGALSCKRVGCGSSQVKGSSSR